MRNRLIVMFSLLLLSATSSLAQGDLPPSSMATSIPDAATRIFIGVAEPAADLTIRKQVGEVLLYFTATVLHGNVLETLKADDIMIVDDGQPVLELHDFRSAGNIPLEIGFLFDVSGSTDSTIKMQQSAASEFFAHGLVHGRDRTFVAAFSSRYNLLQASTADDSRFDAALARVTGTHSPTALYDAIIGACDSFSDVSPLQTRRVLVVLSDGIDNLSYHSLAEAITTAQDANVAIYALRISTRVLNRGERAALDSLAASTGGRVFAVKTTKEGEQAFASLSSALHSQYSASFAAHLASTHERIEHHSLFVLPVRPGLEIHARSGYEVISPSR